MSDKLSIVSYLNRIDLLKETADQIIKDFQMSGFEITFSGNSDNAYKELFIQIYPHINELLGKNYEGFMNLLYRIDLDERLVLRKSEENKHQNTAELITDLIMKRELQKIVIRNYYKQNGTI